MYVKQFNNLIPYQKAMEIIEGLGRERDQYKVYKAKKCLVSILKHIAHAQAVEIYPEMQKYHFGQAIKSVYKAEQEIKKLDVFTGKSEIYLKKLNEVRKILIVLSKKIKVEEQ